MKYLFSLLFSMLFIIPLSAQKADEEAIKKVIIDETTAWANHDTVAHFAAIADNELTQGAYNNRNLSIGTYKGFASIQKNVRDAIKSNAKPFYLPNVERSNWLIKVLSPEWAWVNFSQKAKTIRGETYTSYETRLMHKEGGKWKINVVNAMWDYKNVEMPAVNPDETEIKEILYGENAAFSEGNIDAFMDYYAQVPYLLWTVTNGMEPGEVLTFRGYDALKTFAQGLPWFKNYKPENSQKPKPNNGITKDNWNFQFRGNIALVTYDEHWKNEEKKTNMDLTVTKTLERINGKWKLIITTALGNFKHATPPIRSKY